MKRLFSPWVDKGLNKWLFEKYVSKWMNTGLLFYPKSWSRFRACLFIGKVCVSASSYSLTRINRTANAVGGTSSSSLDHSGLCEHVITQCSAPFYARSIEIVMDSRVQENLAMFSPRSTKGIRGVSEWPWSFPSSSLKLLMTLSQKGPSLCPIAKPIKVYTDLTVPK